MENPIKMDDLGVPLFSETPIWLKKCLVDVCVAPRFLRLLRIVICDPTKKPTLLVDSCGA